jgi:hypothetical protein
MKKKQDFFCFIEAFENLCVNFFCYNYINILLQATHFYSIAATCGIGGPNRTRVSTWTRRLESFPAPRGLSALSLMYWFFVGNTLTCKLPKIKTSRGASVSRAWRVACARKRGSGFRRTGARRIPASHFSGGNLQREHKASCTTVCFYVRVTSEPASIDRICAYDPITGPIYDLPQQS